ncbi:MAG: hypothetical protein WDN04_11850 [Rhodospirillales bacterium]
MARNFGRRTLAAPIDLGRRFDLVQSLETAEHLPAHRAIVDSLPTWWRMATGCCFPPPCRDRVASHHVNEQGLEYWRALFRTHGYVAVDLVRPAVAR